ncbi:hypothetical protein ACFWNT_24205 [Streptomyces sp. NPDC058409]|uniref:hypothetical protein n=1 Tax=unclassified Streptomyces TaxID=2593676 RepID=UPI00365496DB
MTPSFAALAEFIQGLIVQVTNEGLAAARARGRWRGRPTVVIDKLLRAFGDVLPSPESSNETTAALPDVSVGTLYDHIPDLKELPEFKESAPTVARPGYR